MHGGARVLTNSGRAEWRPAPTATNMRGTPEDLLDLSWIHRCGGRSHLGRQQEAGSLALSLEQSNMVRKRGRLPQHSSRRKCASGSLSDVGSGRPRGLSQAPSLAGRLQRRVAKPENRWAAHHTSRSPPIARHERGGGASSEAAVAGASPPRSAACAARRPTRPTASPSTPLHVQLQMASARLWVAQQAQDLCHASNAATSAGACEVVEKRGEKPHRAWRFKRKARRVAQHPTAPLHLHSTLPTMSAARAASSNSCWKHLPNNRATKEA